MQTNRIFALVVILLGSIFLLNNLFDFDINAFKLVFALSLLAAGILLLTGKARFDGFGEVQQSANVLFGKGRSIANPALVKQRFSTVFGEQEVSLEQMAEGGRQLLVDTVFGQTYVGIPRDLPVLIQAQSYFGEVKMPDGREINFGDGRFESLQGLSEPAVTIHLHVVFGSIKVQWL
jgi:predicted membrane protein